MANTYHDMTGVLIANEITPVITAIFGDLRLEKDEGGEGTIGFRVISESESMGWDGIIEGLQTHAEQLGYKLSDDELPDANAEDVLWFLAQHYKSDTNEDLSGLIEQTDFDGDASLDALFTIGMAFDDGHGLAAVKYEGAWHSDQARLFEFGGNGGFMGKHIFCSGDSRTFVSLGEELEKAIGQGDAAAAAEAIRQVIGNLVSGFTSEAVGREVKERLARLLCTEASDSGARNIAALDTDEVRRFVAERVFERFNFGDGFTVQESSGWEWCSGGEDWSRPVFVLAHSSDGPSVKWRFTIRFQPGSALVDEAYAVDAEDNICGSYAREAFYVWTGDGDCDNKTEQLAEAIQWTSEFEAEGKAPYITNADNQVLDLSSLLSSAARK